MSLISRKNDKTRKCTKSRSIQKWNYKPRYATYLPFARFFIFNYFTFPTFHSHFHKERNWALLMKFFSIHWYFQVMWHKVLNYCVYIWIIGLAVYRIRYGMSVFLSFPLLVLFFNSATWKVWRSRAKPSDTERTDCDVYVGSDRELRVSFVCSDGRTPISLSFDKTIRTRIKCIKLQM